MANLKANLKRRLEGAGRVAVLAVGSGLRGDDAAGLLAAEELEKVLRDRVARARFAIFVGDTAPENLTGEIRKFQPTHLIIVDAADVGRKPGHVELLDPDVLTHNPSASTHSLPFSVLVTYLRGFFPFAAVVIGIQPSVRGFGKRPSREVRRAAKRVAALVAGALD